MDRDGQLSFTDDPMLLGINQAYQLLEEGKFGDAVGRIDELLSAKPDYPGFVQAYRTAKFWKNREGEIKRLVRGKQTADFLMTQWESFRKYAQEKDLAESTAYRSVMRYIFFTASEHYKIAFQSQESTADNFDLLMNLGVCFLTLGEYKHTIETLEYARSSYRSNARLLAILAEAYFQSQEIPKSMLLFREAFSLNPSEVDLSLVKAKPLTDLVTLVRERRPGCADPREWVPVYGFLEDVFYVKRQLNSQQVEGIKREIYTMEKSYQSMKKEQLAESNVVPRLINRYLWMLDYFEFQQYDAENLNEIRARLLQIDHDLFEEHFKKGKKQK
jgi:tetratricopeptide (TPR) repeat protein